MAFCQTEKLGASAEHECISINEKRAGRRSARCAKAASISLSVVTFSVSSAVG